ncbi:MAG TPA: LPXTG cell wall anchor domain-containing protein [Terriglobales bacterium]|nr:LPXTG cell wall anchor domain-containing protein [Terriglobales bacterium]
MRKLAFLTLLLALLVGTGIAQDQTTPPPDSAAQQPAADQQQPANPDQPATTTDTQGAADQNANQGTGETLPQTASPLPLIGLLGVGSLVAGVVARKRK